jgi:type VI secretion system protein ImpJ
MSIIQPIQQQVQWFEGMMLSPQHFQQNHIYIEQLMFHQLQRVAPYYHGILNIAFDMTNLSSNQVLVKQLDAVMPDGTIVNYCGSDNENSPLEQRELLSYSLDNVDTKKLGKSFYIYLAIAKQSSVTSDNQTDLKRYDSINFGKVGDLHDSSNTADVVRLRTKLQLCIQSEQLKSYTYLPILKLEKDHNDKFNVADYTPPTLSFAPLTNRTPNQTDLWKDVDQRIAKLRTQASGRLTYLKDQNSTEQGMSYLQKLDIHFITQHLPSLKVMLSSHKAHPFDVYLALMNVVTGMSILQNDILPPDYSDYKHDNLHESFTPLLKSIDSIIEKLELNFEVKALTFHKNERHYTSPLDLHSNNKELMLAFKLSAGVSRTQLEQWIKKAFICDATKLEDLWQHRINGAKRVHTSAFSAINLSESNDELFYIITFEEQFFPGQSKDNNSPTLHISCSDDTINKFAPAMISLYSIKVKGG